MKYVKWKNSTRCLCVWLYLSKPLICQLWNIEVVFLMFRPKKLLSVRLHSKSHQKSSKFRVSLGSGTVTPSPDTTPIHFVTPFIYPVTPCYNPCYTPFTSLVFKIMSWIMTYDKRLVHGSIKWVRHAVCTRYSLIGFHAGVRGN